MPAFTGTKWHLALAHFLLLLCLATLLRCSRSHASFANSASQVNHRGCNVARRANVLPSHGRLVCRHPLLCQSLPHRPTSAQTLQQISCQRPAMAPPMSTAADAVQLLGGSCLDTNQQRTRARTPQSSRPEARTWLDGASEQTTGLAREALDDPCLLFRQHLS